MPDDLIAYLSDPKNRTLKLKDGEVRELTFFAPSEFRLKKFDVDSCEFSINGRLEEDPDQNFEYEGYDLIKSCPNYDPEGILILFPEWKQYGS